MNEKGCKKNKTNKRHASHTSMRIEERETIFGNQNNNNNRNNNNQHIEKFMAFND